MANKTEAENISSKALRTAIGNKIREYREQAGISQEDFRKAIGLKNRATLSLIENGEQSISIDALVRVVQITRLDLMSLLELNTRRLLVIDTNIILNRPEMLRVVIGDCDVVYVPKAVIEEINYQKDHGREKEKRNASLCLGLLGDLHRDENNKDSLIINAEPSVKRETNDDCIMQVAVDIAAANPEDSVFMFTNDKDFLLKDIGKTTNLRVIDPKAYTEVFVRPDGMSPALSQRFFMAVMKRDLEQAKKLMGKSGRNINVNYIDTQSGLTPLIKAVRNKDYQMIKFLLSLDRIDINAVDDFKYKFPPLSHAIQTHDITSFRILIDGGADVNEPSQNTTNSYNTPLMIAAWEGQLEMVKALVDNGACLNQQDKKNGFTALIKAVFRNKDDIVRFLLEAGADKTISSYERKRAEDYARDNRNMKILSMLTGKGRGENGGSGV